MPRTFLAVCQKCGNTDFRATLLDFPIYHKCDGCGMVTSIYWVDTIKDLLDIALNRIGADIHQNAVDHGFWEQDRNDGEMIALCHSELSEALEAIRHGNPPSDHIPDFSGAEEEFADLVIRVLDTAHARGYRLGEAITAKMAFNANRPYKHGKGF